MATTKIVARKNKVYKNGIYVPLQILYSHCYRTTYFSTQVVIPFKDFDSARCEIRKTNKNHVKYNALLRKLQNEIDDIVLDAKLKEIDPTIEYVKSYFGKEKLEKVLFMLFLEIFAKDQVRLKKPATIKSYWVSIHHLKLYRDYIGRDINYEDIDRRFYEDFLRFLYDHFNLGFNAAGNHIKNLKVFLNASLEQGLHNNLNHRQKWFKVPAELSEAVALDENELKRIYGLDLSKDPKLDMIRSLFYCACWTGLRWLDAVNISAEHIQGDYIVVNTRKTDERVVIPIHPTVKPIIAKYLIDNETSLWKGLSNQEFNSNIKIVCNKGNYSPYNSTRCMRKRSQKYINNI